MSGQITAKMVVSSKVYSGEGDQRQANVVFGADYADGRNKEWALYTPGASLNMGLRGAIADRFEVGQAYTLTLELSDDQPAPAVPAEATAPTEATA